MTAPSTTSRTFKPQAYRFLAWRKKRGGAVADLRGKHDRRFDSVTLNQGNAQDSGVVELDLIFARNEKTGRYA